MSITFFAMRVSIETLTALGELTGHYWSNAISLEPAIDQAIREYVANQRKPAPAVNAPSSSGEPVRQAEGGYQWKQLFLPQGTKLRASFGKKSYFAEVLGDQIRHWTAVAHRVLYSNTAPVDAGGNGKPKRRGPVTRPPV